MERTKRIPKRRFREFLEVGEWEEHELGELVNINSGQDYKHLSEGDIPVYGTGGYMLSVNKSLSEEDGIGIGRKGTIDKPMLLKAPFWTVDTLFFAVPHKGYDIHFSFNIFERVDWHLHDESTGVPSLSRSNINSVKTNIPSVLEQKKIGNFCCRLDTLISLHQQKLAKLKALKQAYLTEMFPAPGEKRPRRRFKGFSGDWEEYTLGQLCNEFHSGKFIPADKVYDRGQYPVYGGNGLRGYTDSFNHDGEYALIGRQGALCGNMNYSKGKAYFTEHAVAIKANDTADTSFLYYLCGLMDLGQYSGQSAQPGLAVSNIILVAALVPERNEQIAIGRFFQHFDELIFQQENKVAKFQSLKQAYLSELFV